MEPARGLLDSVKCGTCTTSISKRFYSNGKVIYKCSCLLKIRALLICVNCNKQFLNKPYLIRKTNYCSLKCYWSGTNRKQLRVCKICAKDFYAKANLIKKGFGFYCSMKCWFNLFRKQRKIIKCKQCQKERSVYTSVYLKNPKFCSKKCSDESKIDNIFRICQNCNKSFKITRSGLKRGRGHFCTWECYKKYKGESSLELLVRLQLEKLNEPFQQELRFGKFRADFFLPKRNLIIECDGEYWHLDPKIVLRDKRKDKLFQKLGYIILRLTGQDIVNYNFILILETLFRSKENINL